jgi:N-methylhydantoinase B
VDSVVVEPGEQIGQHHTGGGGYGDPLEREPERVRADVLAGFISFARAREAYGVVFAEETASAALRVDEEATRRLRKELGEAADA